MNSLKCAFGRRILSSVKFSTRIPGKIFNEFSESITEQDGQSDRFQSKKPLIESNSTFAFLEEANQDYNLAAFSGTSISPFSSEIIAALSEPVDEELIEIKPDGSCYLPEVQYRRILNKAFGIGGWSLIPRSPHSIQGNVLSREYALFALGKYISQARGHTTMTGSFQNPALCTEAVRSNALMRCCKDLGVAASLWDNQLMSQWKNRFANRKSVTDYQGRSKTIWEKRRE